MSHRVPFRLKVLRALSSSLEEINPINGYEHDMRGAVKRGRLTFGPKDPLPMISILEAPIPLEVSRTRGDNVSSAGPWELLIQGFVKDDFDHPSDPAHHLMAEVKAHLVKEKQRERGHNALSMQGRIADMYIGQGSVRPPDEVSNKAFFWLTLTLHIGEYLDDPYK